MVEKGRSNGNGIIIGVVKRGPNYVFPLGKGVGSKSGRLGLNIVVLRTCTHGP